MPRVHYAQSWEDPLLLWEIWQLTQPEHVHMIASGGDHAFELLQKGIERIEICDMESAQLEHVQGKLKALHHRDRDRLYGYGPKATSQGLLHDGRLEGYLRLFSQRILPWMVSAKDRAALTQQSDAQSQAKYLETHWNSWLWRKTIAYLFDPKQIDNNARHPGLVHTLGREKRSINYYHSFLQLLGKTKLSENPYLDYILYGKHIHSTLPYLEDPSFQPKGRLILKQQALQTLLQNTPAAKRFIHASDILESYEEQALPSFFQAVDQACSTGSLLVFWDHRYSTPIPPSFLALWDPIPHIQLDRVPFYYAFHAFQKR